MDEIKTKNDETHFGYKTVLSKEKTSLVENLFNNVSFKYDLMNDLMSLGIHRIWKDTFINMINRNDAKILDLAGGTGDITLRYLEKYKPVNPSITICDLSVEMLEIGKNKVIDYGICKGVEYIVGDGENLPFNDNSFDVVTISFGIRNITNISNCLKEIKRVLKPMGKFLCLEFSNVKNEITKKFYDFYSFNIIPKIGKLVADDLDSYQYLVESIRKFPDQETFKDMILNAGFKNVSYQNLTGGIVAIHYGWKF